MSRDRNVASRIAAIAAILAGCAWILHSNAQAQDVRGGLRAAAGPRLFHPRSAATPPQRPAAPSPPPPMSPPQRAALLQAAGVSSSGTGNTYVHLDPRSLAVQPHGWIIAQGGLMSGMPGIDISAGEDGAVMMNIDSEAAGRMYVVDCAIDLPLDQTTTFEVKDFFGQGSQTITLAGTSQHVAWVLQTADDGWYTFHATADHAWKLFSCDVSRL